MNVITDKIYHLAECPLWNETEQALYWTDILNGEIWRYREIDGISELFWKGDMQVGGFAFNQKNELILCADKGVFRLDKAGRTTLLFDIIFEKGERFNDITTDPAGRIIAGTKCENLKNGKLYIFENKKAPEIVLDKIGISNGMTFSLDHNYFYHTDSIMTRVVYCDTIFA